MYSRTYHQHNPAQDTSFLQKETLYPLSHFSFLVTSVPLETMNFPSVCRFSYSVCFKWKSAEPVRSFGTGFFHLVSAEELILLNCGVGEDSWESVGLQGDPLVHSDGDQPWDFFGRSYAKAETAVLWPPHAKSWLIEKTLLLERESEWTPGAGDGQGGLAFCNSWGCKESDTTEWLNWNKHLYILLDCNGGNMGVYTCQNLIELYILNGSILFF